MGDGCTHLVSELKRGNQGALKLLYEQNHKQLFYLAKRYLKNKELAEDAVQDVFLKIWKNRNNLDSDLSLEGYLFTVLKNHVLNVIRDEGKRKQVLEEMKQTVKMKPLAPNGEEQFIYLEYYAILDTAIRELTPVQQEVFRLRSVEGLTNAEIAKKRNVSMHTVKTQYYLGSKHVRTFLKKYAGLFISILTLLQQ